MPFPKWPIVLVGLIGALPAAAAQLPPATIALPGLYAPEVDPASRALFGQQLAATLEGQGFTVLDVEALDARDIAVHPDGCFSPLPPLCGAGPGVDQVVLGSIVPGGEAGGFEVTVELVDGGDRRSLWAGRFKAASEGEVSAGLIRIATEHLPSASRRARVFDDRPRFLGMTQRGWGSSLMVAGVVMMAGGGVLASEAVQNQKRLDSFERRGIEPIPAREAFRMRDTHKGQVVAASILGAVGLTAAVSGFFVMKSGPEKPVAIQFAPSGGGGMLVVSGVLP